MAFDIQTFPGPVQLAFRLSSPPYVRPVIWAAEVCGIKDPNKLADLAFYFNHPELSGKKLQPHQSKLVSEWKAYHSKLSKRILKAAAKAKQDTEKRLEILQALASLRVNDLVSGREKRDEMKLLIRIAKLYVAGCEIDQKFWRYTAFDGMGRRNPNAPITLKKHSVGSAFHYLDLRMVRDTSPKAIGNSIKNAHRWIDDEVTTLLNWITTNVGSRDALLDTHAEFKFIKEVERKMSPSNSISVFCAFHGRFCALQYRSIGKRIQTQFDILTAIGNMEADAIRKKLLPFDLL